MRKALCVFAGLMLAAAASAAPINLYFSTQNQVESALGAGDAPVPAEFVGQTIPSVNPGETLYLWATIQLAPDFTTDPIVGMELDFAGPTVSGTMYNPDMNTSPFGNLWRWNRDNPNASNTDSPIALSNDNGPVVGVGQPLSSYVGIGSSSDTLAVAAPDFSAIHFLVAELTPDTPGDLYVDVVSLATGEAQDQLIQVGFGDDMIGATGGTSAMADAIVLPEPASLVLLGLAALAIRRR